jgi:serine/threonine protein kinase
MSFHPRQRRESSTPIALPGAADTQREYLSAVARPASETPLVGGRYRLVSSLGRGAMGQVFAADEVTTGRRVAVKVLRPELLADKSSRGRFAEEARALAAITHPHVARFVDVGLGDPCFVVMEYVPGRTLRERIRGLGRLPVDEAVRIAAQLCEALEAVHAAGIVHRDVKPSNVILVSDDGIATPRLIDFGLAKRMSGVGAELTRKGQVVGTPQYMSPEQVSGRGIDARTDQYALGCVTYEMLTGDVPFDADTALAVFQRQLNEAPQPLRERVPGLPRALDAVLRRVMAKDPRDRYPSMKQLACALKASLQPQPPWFQQLGSWVRALGQRRGK